MRLDLLITIILCLSFHFFYITHLSFHMIFSNPMQLETSNLKLAYQAKHLKRSLQEADQKLKQAEK